MKRLTTAVGLLLSLCGCNKESREQAETQAAWADSALKVSSKKIDGITNVNVWSAKGTKLDSMAKLGIFEEFHPGLTFEQAESRLGKPDATRTAKNMAEFRHYSRSNVSLAVAKELYFSGSESAPAEVWTVWAFPTRGSLPVQDFASSNVLARVELPQPPYMLVLRDGTIRSESLWARVDSNGVSEIRWIKP